MGGIKNIISAGLLVGGFLVFAFVLMWQGLHFFKNGEWLPVSIFDLLTFISPELANSFYPNNWRGFAMILTWLHGGLLIMVIAVLLSFGFQDP